ncbi:DUF3800 domain-containing protein [Citricoccus parietis]|uniref:DUF3800 domain-containing protein n=1 Tax=Citricoccus parietis TaxID=592307 RepID=A0ABV6F941_9MICC
MYLAYLDESGNTGRKLDDPDQPFHFMAAVLVPEVHVNALAKALDSLVASSGVAASTELHGAALFRGAEGWEKLSPEQRVDLYREAVGLLGTFECVVAHSSIDKQKLALRYGEVDADRSPHVLSFQFLVEKLEYYLRSTGDPMLSRALLVADETDEHRAFQFELIQNMQRDGGGIGHKVILDRIIDTVHFAVSTENRGVQLSDLVAYALNRSRRAALKKPRSRGDEALLKILDEQIAPHVRTYRQTWG